MNEFPESIPQNGPIFPYKVGDTFAGATITSALKRGGHVAIELEDGRQGTYTDQSKMRDAWKLVSENRASGS
ncbi:hypothetical protein [Rothia uropygialis]|uniref:hypothetical protein n=1 Tax=Kocuria sp. 36 TaxID=1415402 RepID=UPI00101BA0BE|nr:hypothetical protein [Kocuria sp. 36]